MTQTRWSEGARAFEAGQRLDSNPYGTCGPAYREWRNGWDSASWGDLAKRQQLLRLQYGTR